MKTQAHGSEEPHGLARWAIYPFVAAAVLLIVSQCHQPDLRDARDSAVPGRPGIEALVDVDHHGQEATMTPISQTANDRVDDMLKAITR